MGRRYRVGSLAMVQEEPRPNISITALDDAVSIIHIPIDSHVERHASDIFWTIERATDDSVEFFNITSNCIEMAVFAQCQLIEEVWGTLVRDDAQLRLSSRWRVFEVSSGDCDDLESGNYANITILYQSSYHADFLLVKETDFEQASAIFTVHDWTVNTTSNPSPRSSATGTPIWPLSPIPANILNSPPLEKQAMALARVNRQLSSLRSPTLASSSPSPPEVNLALLSSPLAVVGFNESSSNHVGKIQKYITWPERCLADLVRAESRARSQSQSRSRERSGSPSPDSRSRNRRGRQRLGLSVRPFISYTRTQDGASLITDVEAIRYLFPDANNGGVLCGDEFGFADDSEAEESEYGGDDYDDDDDDDGGEQDEGEETDVDEALEVETGSDRCTPPRHDDSSDAHEQTSMSFEQAAAWPGSPHFEDVKTPPQPSYLEHRKHDWGHHRSYSAPISPGMAFGDLTKGAARPELPKRSSNPTTTKGHRWSVISNSRGSRVPSERSKKRKGRKLCLQLDLSTMQVEEDGTYHLDKSGLVTQFSTALQKRNIRMLYSSTFHTANILVEARDVDAAQEVLRPSRVRAIKHVA